MQKYIAIQTKPYSVVAFKTFTTFNAAMRFVDDHEHIIKMVNDDSTHCVVTYSKSGRYVDVDVHMTSSLDSATALLKSIAKNRGMSTIGDEYAMKPHHFAEVLSDINVVEF